MRLPHVHAIDRLSIRVKLYLGFGAILALLLGVAATTYWGTSNLTSSADRIDVVVSKKLLVAKEMSAAAGDFHFAQTKYALVGPSGREDFVADVGAFKEVLAEADRNTTDSGDRATLNQVKAAFADFMRSTQRCGLQCRPATRRRWSSSSAPPTSRWTR
jgi:hypothetical protein